MKLDFRTFVDQDSEVLWQGELPQGPDEATHGKPHPDLTLFDFRKVLLEQYRFARLTGDLVQESQTFFVISRGGVQTHSHALRKVHRF